MKLSEDRILTTHVGSLPRVRGLADLLVARDEGGDIDADDFEATLQLALNAIIECQVAAGIDIGNDGEMPRPSFASYLAARMTGFGRGGAVDRPLPLDAKTFPIWFEQIQRSARRRLNVYNFPQAIGEVRYEDTSAVIKECDDFLACLGKRSGGFLERFMTAVSPGFAATAMINRRFPRTLHDSGLAGVRSHGDDQPAL